jgi:hypothetical protein
MRIITFLSQPVFGRAGRALAGGGLSFSTLQRDPKA